MVDLIGVLLLIYNLFTFGQPNDIKYSFSISLDIQYQTDISASLGLKVDPVLIYEINDKNKPYCGMFFYNAIVLNDASMGKCEDTLSHELNHWKQRQAVGPFMFLGNYLPCNNNLPHDIDGIWCAHPNFTDRNMLLPKGLNYPLFEIKIPLFWDTSK